MLRLLAIVVAFIVYALLYPFQFDFNGMDASPLMILLHAWPATINRFAWRKRRGQRAALFSVGADRGFGTDASIAARGGDAGNCPAGTGRRDIDPNAADFRFDAERASLLDVACNFAGTVGGAGAVLPFRPEIVKDHAAAHRRSGARGALMLACCWAGYQLYPFIPRFSTYRLRDQTAQFLATPISMVEAFASAAEWFAFALVVRAVAGRLKAPWLLLAMVCLPLRMVIVERTVAPGEVIGAGLAMLAWSYPAEGSRVRAAAAMLALAIVLRELWPFAFTMPAQAMSWIPFSATLSGERMNAALVLLRKAFEYGTLVWLLRASGLRYWTRGSVGGSGVAAAGNGAARYAEPVAGRSRMRYSPGILAVHFLGQRTAWAFRAWGSVSEAQ